MSVQERTPWVIVGLGNPGPEYADTRHNFGFMVLDRMAAQAGVRFRTERRLGGVARLRESGISILLLQPHTYMNRSGEAVLRVLKTDGAASRLLVVHDDLDLPFGTLRIKAGGGSGGHKGIASIVAETGMNEFWRLRGGIGRPHAGDDVVDHVLSPFSAEEREWLDAFCDRAVAAVWSLIREGPAKAMNRFNGPLPTQQ